MGIKKSCQREKKAAQFIKQLGKYSNTCSDQQTRLLLWFKHVSSWISTTEARQELGIMNPPARIFYLRNKGYKINLVWISEFDKNGVKHRMGYYVFDGRHV